VKRVVEIAVDLREDFGPVRDQGPRPTCLAFAVSDTHAGLRNDWEALSCELAFFHALRRAERPPGVGATLPHMLDALKLDGQPVEEAWPYLTATPAASAWSPSAEVGMPLRPGWRQPWPRASAWVRAALDSDLPAILLLRLRTASTLPNSTAWRFRPRGDPAGRTVRHAVVAVPHGKVDGDPAILVRNSWGADWGMAGHAWLTEPVVTPRLFGLAILGEEVDVPAYSAAA